MSIAIVVGCIASSACGDTKKTVPSAEPTATAATTTRPATTKPKEMPSVTVDDMGPYINGQRPSLKDPGGAEKLKKIVSELPIDGKEVTLIILKKAKFTDVRAVVRELGAAGAPTVRVKTADGRKDLPGELVITPQHKLDGKPIACTLAAMVGKDLATAIWPIAGGIGKKHVKGFAGPDLTNTGESLKKDLPKCESPTVFLSADESLDWELAHNLGGTVINNDEKKKVQNLVLLDETPVPGRPVKLD